MKVLSTLDQISFTDPLDREVYHLKQAKDRVQVRDSLIIGKGFLESLLNKEDEAVSTFKENYEALTLNASYEQDPRVNLIVDSKSIREGLYLNIIGMDNLLLALEQVKDGSDFFIIQPFKNVEATIEVYERVDFFSVLVYEGLFDINDTVQKDEYFVKKDFVNVEDQDIKKQPHTFKPTPYSNVLQKQYEKGKEADLVVKHDVVEDLARKTKRMNTYKGKRAKAVYVKIDGTIYLQRFILEETKESDERRQNNIKKTDESSIEEESLSIEKQQIERKSLDEEDVDIAEEGEDIDISTPLPDIDIENENKTEDTEEDEWDAEYDAFENSEDQEYNVDEESEESYEEESVTETQDETIFDDVDEDEDALDFSVDEDGVDDFIFDDHTEDLKDEIRMFVRKNYKDKNGYFPQDVYQALEGMDIEEKEILRKGLDEPLSEDEASTVKSIL